MAKLEMFIILSLFSMLQAAKLPTYLTQCSINDPKLNECFKRNANLAIPDIAKGDFHYDIQSALPLRFQGPIVTKDNNLQVIVTNLELHGLEFSKVTDVQLDLEKGTFTMVMETPSISAFAHCEANADVHGVTVSNDEILNEKLVNVSNTYSKNFTLVNIDGEQFIKSLNHTIELQVKNQYTGFFTDFGDIKEDKTVCQQKLPQVVQDKIGDYITAIFENLVVRVPVKDFFLSNRHIN